MRIALIGPGAMGRALLQGWAQSGASFDCSVLHPDLSGTVVCGVPVVARLDALTEPVDVVVLAVKPQVLKDVLPDVATWIKRQSKKPLVCSVAASKPSSFYEAYLGAEIPFVRLMPNLPVAQGAGIIGTYAASLSEADEEQLRTMCAPLGQMIAVSSEELLEVLTVLAGSGPAYLCYLVESMVQFARSYGIPAAEAGSLMAQLLHGTALMLKEDPAVSAAEHRRRVTSPQGVTMAAIQTFEVRGFNETVHAALQAALDRLHDLANPQSSGEKPASSN